MIRCCLLLIVCSFCVRAQSPPGALAEPLTLERALQLAEGSNPQLRAAQAVVEGAAAGIVTARQRPNPEFSTNFGSQQITLNGSVPGQLAWFGVAQPIELGSVRRARIDAAS